MANETITAEQLAEISNPASAYVDSGQPQSTTSGITAEQLADISNPANSYVEGPTTPETVVGTPDPGGVTADQLADLSNPANAYTESGSVNSTNTSAEAVSDDGGSQPAATEKFDEKGNSQGKESQPNLNKDTAAQVQTGILQSPGFFGDQQMKNSDVAFNKAINMCTAVAGFASLLQRTSAPPNYSRATSRQYFLTEIEKEAINRKSDELARAGVVPYDVLRTFFFILAAMENVSDLAHVSAVVGIPQLNDARFVRNIRGILNINDIYKVGYLANGVAAVISAFSPKYSSVASVADPYRSRGGHVEQSVEIARALGVLGPLILSTANSLNGASGALQNAPVLSSSAINNSINSVAQLATGAAIALSGAAGNPTVAVQRLATQVGANVVGNLINATPLGGVLRSFGPLGTLVAGPLLQQFGGYAIGNFMSELLTGSRIPTQKIANNPTLKAPSYAGKCFFGETPCALPAVDQVFCRKVGSFGNPSGAAGTESFGMQNFASLGGAIPITSIVARMTVGTSVLPPQTTFIGQQVLQLVNNVTNILNVPTNSTIELRRSDNAIPFMIGMSAAIAEDTFSPFGSRPMMDGWKVAASAANDIQKTNPQYIETCRTSL